MKKKTNNQMKKIIFRAIKQFRENQTDGEKCFFFALNGFIGFLLTHRFPPFFTKFSYQIFVDFCPIRSIFIINTNKY